MEALELMMRFEEDGLRFYEKLGSSLNERGMDGLCGLLVDSQKRQIAVLSSMEAKQVTSGVEPGGRESDGLYVNGFSRLLHAADIKHEMRYDRDAFAHVMHAEEDMIRLCEGMARAEANQDVRALLIGLAENEKQHMLEIEEIYDFVESPGCYLEWGEFSNLHTL